MVQASCLKPYFLVRMVDRVRISDVLGQLFRFKLDACFDRYWTPISVIAITDIQ
jgi:hypothetical protein